MRRVEVEHRISCRIRPTVSFLKYPTGEDMADWYCEIYVRWLYWSFLALFKCPSWF